MLCFAACLGLSQPAWSETDHDDFDVVRDESISLDSLLDAAVERQPQLGVLEASGARAAAESAFGNRWFPDAMELSGYHLSDRAFKDRGLHENEVAVSMPLWMPGEKKAQVALGEAMVSAQDSRRAEFRWRVSGRVRQQVWQTAMTERQWKLALEQESRLAQTLEQVRELTRAGDLSRADELAMVQELAIWKAERMTLHAAYQDSVREYFALVGTTRFPTDISENLSAREEINDEHPALQMALDQLASEQAALERAREQASARPAVQVFWRDFRADDMQPEDNALGIGLAVPLGRSPRKHVAIAEANENLAYAQSRVLEIRRDLGLGLHEARHWLDTIRLKLENSESMVQAARERHRLDQAAFELGEFSLREWLRRLSQTKEIEQSHQLLQMQEGAAIASFNQAVGDTL